MGEHRATRHRERRARRTQMLEAAEALLRDWSYTDITMDRIADRCRIAKGTLYLYYRTKEALFLALFEEHLLTWYSELESLAARDTHTVDPSAAARVIGSTLAARPTLVRLHGVVYSAGGRNIDLDTVVGFRRRQQQAMRRLAAALAVRIRGLTGERAVRFLVRLEVIVGGLSWAAFPPQLLARAYEADELSPFLFDLEEELADILTALLR
jgi:AcrR family transcriptional regulator